MSYSVQFGDLSTMPSCSCFDWQKHHWPCKHFLAIYQHFPEWGWEAMSPIYKDSPYFKIDSNVVPNDSMMISTLKASTDSHYKHNTVPSSGEVHTAQSDEVPLEEFNDSNSQKQPIINLKHEGRTCREILKELQNLTYPLRLSLKRKHEEGINISSSESKQKKVISFPEQDISNTLINGNETRNTNDDLEKDEIDLEERNMVGHQLNNVRKPNCKFEATQIHTDCAADAPENNLPEFLKKEKIVIDENSPDPEAWLTIHNSNQTDSKVTLYLVSKTNILNPNGWLS